MPTSGISYRCHRKPNSTGKSKPLHGWRNRAGNEDKTLLSEDWKGKGATCLQILGQEVESYKCIVKRQ